MGAVDTVENFHGVYLLYCLNPKYEGRTYIGYTVDPNRRIKQHNKGKRYGGAWKTSNKGPWSMVLIVYGFPNDVAALRFEWAWQHPDVSRRLQHVPKKKAREKKYDFCIRVLCEMLSVGPWYRLPLTIRWFNAQLVRNLTLIKAPPMHMPICQGPVVSKKIQKNIESVNPAIVSVGNCNICFKHNEGRSLKCLNTSCDLSCHVICLSKYFLEEGQYVPVQGRCPKCKGTFLWGDIVRKYKGCYNNLDLQIDVGSVDNLYCSDSE
ncbi:hypothetical protein NQ315_000272 [Exocentrus adspersus]|uniref:Structure-specific endonuclease subunit SLX1 homolog n=1 Tax=Exocentrus adspersus TaxID=1586481 RepID=A0AAV8VRH1_9CUCU|nr:hypothetical protein NQ315_000272 [Exocentrus adspersus]